MMGYNCLELTLNYQLDQMQREWMRNTKKILFPFKFFSFLFCEVHKNENKHKRIYIRRMTRSISTWCMLCYAQTHFSFTEASISRYMMDLMFIIEMHIFIRVEIKKGETRIEIECQVIFVNVLWHLENYAINRKLNFFPQSFSYRYCMNEEKKWKGKRSQFPLNTIPRLLTLLTA